MLLRTRKSAFAEHYVVPMVQEADKLGLSTDELVQIITQLKEVTLMNLDVQLDRVSVTYGSVEAVRDISLRLPAGKIYGLLGRNGAGKTSLLSILASFREPSSGSVAIGGEQPFENAKIMREVSFIYDVDYKDETDKVKAAIESVARYRPHFDTAYALELARKFNLPLDKQLKQLSKGMQSAFNVCIGLASRSPVTILDEVYLGMDAPSREIFTGNC